MPSSFKQPRRAASGHQSPPQDSATPSASKNDQPAPLNPGEPSVEKSISGEGNSPRGSMKVNLADDGTENMMGTKRKLGRSSSKGRKKPGKQRTKADDPSATPKKSPSNASPTSSSEESSEEKGATGDSDIFSSKADDSDDEATDDLIQRAKERAVETAKTVTQLNAFLDNTKDKHFINLDITPLAGKSNWSTWAREIQLVMRMHHVSALCEGTVRPLEKDHAMYLWYQHWVDVAIACIYKHVSPSVREDPCFVQRLLLREPLGIMDTLWVHYGPHGGPHGAPHDDSDLGYDDSDCDFDDNSDESSD